jgi:predicted phage-related endonuclease
VSATLDSALRQGVGASEVAALFGMHPYLSALGLYARIVAPQDVTATAVQRRGMRAERYLADEYAERHGLLEVYGVRSDWDKAIWCPPTQRHPVHDFLIASPDRIEFHDGNPVRVVEIKTARSRIGWEDPDETPDGAPMHYILQVAQQMLVGFDGEPIERGTLVASVGHIDDYREYSLTRSPKIEAAIIERVGAFWHDHVLPKRPPDWDGSEAGDALLRAMYPADTRPALLPATDEANAIMAEYRHAQLQVETWEAKADTAKQIIKALIGDAAGLEGNGWRATWKRNRDSTSIDWKAVAEAAGASHALIAAHTTTKPGARVFRTTWRNET